MVYKSVLSGLTNTFVYGGKKRKKAAKITRNEEFLKNRLQLGELLIFGRFLFYFLRDLTSVWIISVISLIYWKWMKWSRAFDQTRAHKGWEGEGVCTGAAARAKHLNNNI